MNKKLEAQLTPVKCVETDFTGQGSEGLNQIRLRLPIKLEEFSNEAYEEQKWYMIATMLGFHVRRYLLRASSSLQRFDSVEYALGFGGLPKARFDDSGGHVNAFDSIDAIKDRETGGNFTIYREEYKSAPIEARIYVLPDSVLCEYQCTDEQRPDENGVIRNETKIIARVTVPEKSVHVDFVLRNFQIKK
jgi:hypothetical protein